MLRVTSSASGRSNDVVATVEPPHSVEALRLALVAQAGVGGGDVLIRRSTGKVLDRSVTLGDIGLVSGEELVLGSPGDAAAAPALTASVVVEAVGGPAAGWRVELGPGTYTLGRAHQGSEQRRGFRAIPDGTVSRSHVTVVVDRDLRVTLQEDPDAKNPMLVDGVRPTGPMIVDDTMEISLGDSLLVCRRTSPPPPARIDQLGQVAFHRTPLRPSRPTKVVLPTIAKVPARLEPPKFSYIASAAPLIGGIFMAVALGEPKFLLFTVLAPITGVATFFENRKRGRQAHAREVEAFEKRFAERELAFEASMSQEEAIRLAAAPDVADLRRRAERRDPTLWSRGRGITEFLMLRAGLGPATTHITAEFGKDGDESLLERLETLADRYAAFDRVPANVALAELGVMGVHGARSEVTALATALLVQAVCLHSPEDLVVVAAAPRDLELIRWLRWLPHTHSTGSPIGGPHLAEDRRSADDLLRALLEVAEFRALGSGHGVDRRWPWVLAAIDRSVEPDPHLVAQVLDRCPDAGISVLWLSDAADRIPPQCRVVAELADRSQPGAEQLSRLWFTDPEVPTQLFSADGADPSLPDGVARSLAPLRDASSATATASIPRLVPLFAAHGIDEATTTWVQQQWAVDRRRDRTYALETVVGLTADGPLCLDLVSDGPHGLIGGTSGAGKSELIQALVAGLVAYQSPRDLSLMFIDFKGGSASEVFKDLPHISGRVTDLDESLALRARISLRAELRRRVELFSKVGMKDMADMRRLHPEQAPPSLVIVIDEFATLVKQLPEFVTDLIDIAQRGRSYGVHLLLATQRPSSSVDDNILANTNLRISLRMLDRAESMSILNAPDAAEIPVPLKGRSIARMGPGQLVEFQSAYCSTPLSLTNGLPPVLVEPLGVAAPGAGGSPAPADDGAGAATAPRTQLDALIDAIKAVSHPTVRQIWNDLLPTHLTLAAADAMDRLASPVGPPGREVLLGAADDPANQRQHACTVDLEGGGGLLVLGTGGSGKSTVLRTIAASAVVDDLRAGGGTVMLFVLDFSSGSLRSLAELAQCAGLGTLDDLEATTRIIETVHAEVGRRRHGAGGTGGGAGAQPTILLLVDGYSNLVDVLQNTGTGQEQSSEKWLDAFHRIVLDGRQLGVHTVLTADRGAAVRNAIYAAVTRRLVLRQPDPAETSSLGLPSTQNFPPGAGFLDGLRIQVATVAAPGQDEHEAVREFAASMREFVDDAEIRSPQLLAPALPAFLHRPSQQGPDRGLSGLVGLADVSGTEVPFDLSNLDLLVTGPPMCGKSWAVRTLAEQLEAGGQRVYAIGAEDSGLRTFPWKASGWGAADVASLIGTLKAELEFPGREAVLVVDDLDLLESPAFDTAVQGLGQNRAIHLIGSTTSFGYSNNELVRRIVAARQVLYLQPGSSREVAERIGVMRLPVLRLGLPLPPGRGMFVRSRVPTVLQTYAPDAVTAEPRPLGD
jgi:S-DNA-T family DNA segregation ATPase FtsK/SpoIIIE